MKKKSNRIHERILFDQKLKNHYNGSLELAGVVLPVEESNAYTTMAMSDEEKKILEQELKDAADRIYKETSVVGPPIDYIGIGKDTKGMNLTEALNKSLSDMNVDIEHLREIYRKEENKDE